MSDATTRETQHTEAGGQESGLRLSFPTHRPALPAPARRRLFQLLVGKSVLETLLVAALAVSFYYSTFNPSFRGALDYAGAGRVEGWAVDDSRPGARVEVHLYVDGRFVASANANQSRPDVRSDRWAPDEFHGFSFNLNGVGAGEHEARVYAVHVGGDGNRGALHLVGRPVRFNIPGP